MKRRASSQRVRELKAAVPEQQAALSGFPKQTQTECVTEPRGSELRAGLCPVPSCSWTLSQPGISCLMMHKPPSLPSASSLLPRQQNPADSNYQRHILIRGQKSHPYCTPVSTIFIREAFELC